MTGSMLQNKLPGVPTKLTKLKRHSYAKKQDKSPNYRLLEAKISNLEFHAKFVQNG